MDRLAAHHVIDSVGELEKVGPRQWQCAHESHIPSITGVTSDDTVSLVSSHTRLSAGTGLYRLKKTITNRGLLYIN